MGEYDSERTKVGCLKQFPAGINGRKEGIASLGRPSLLSSYLFAHKPLPIDPRLEQYLARALFLRAQLRPCNLPENPWVVHRHRQPPYSIQPQMQTHFPFSEILHHTTHKTAPFHTEWNIDIAALEGFIRQATTRPPPDCTNEALATKSQHASGIFSLRSERQLYRVIELSKCGFWADSSESACS